MHALDTRGLVGRRSRRLTRDRRRHPEVLRWKDGGVRTLIVSDLHLGAPARHDLLRHAGVRRALLEAVERADRVVLLGDVLELRGVPAREALDRAREALGEIGEAAGESPISVVPGNHDHHLAADWLERRRQRGARLALEAEWRPGRSGLAARLARALGARDVTLAYPGTFVAPGVYATHGHYLDCHNSVPALEALAAAATARVTGGLPGGPLAPDAYEAVLTPIYALAYQLAQATDPSRRRNRPGASLRLWQRLNPPDGRPSPSTIVLGRLAVPGLVAAVNRAGLGPFSADLSPADLRRAALRAMATVVDRLGIPAGHVVFGHTHRAGPLPGDDPGDGWALGDGRRLWNSGAWVHEPPLIGSRGMASGHWPGASIVVEDGGPPRLKRWLGADALRPAHAAMRPM